MMHKSYSLYKGYAIFLLPGIIVFLTLIVVPFLANIGISFTKWSGVGTPIWNGVANYTKAFSDNAFWTSFRNNLYLILVMTITPTFIGLVLSVVLFEFVARKFGQRVASFFRAGFYLPQVIPIVVAAIVWRWILQPEWGAINSLLTSLGMESLTKNWLGTQATALPAIGMMLIWYQIGYPLVIFMAGLQRIDPEINEAAAIDGASWLKKLIYITIPLLRPEIYVVVLTTTIHALKTFAPIYAMTGGGPGSATMVASYFSYKNYFETSNVGLGSTMATVLTLLVMLITIVYIRVQTRQEQQEGG